MSESFHPTNHPQWVLPSRRTHTQLMEPDARRHTDVLCPTKDFSLQENNVTKQHKTSIPN